MTRSLDELKAALAGARWLRAPAAGVRIHRVTADSRRVVAGSLFVAIRGERRDGHEHLDDAVARGAAALVVEREVPGVAALGVPVLRVRRSRQALAELAAAWHGRPAQRLPLVGITGTLGKTSVLSMLEAILARAGRRVGTIGSLGVSFDGELKPTGHTVPGPLVLQAALARMADAGAELVAMEVTSHALSQGRVHGLRFALGVFTNLVPLEHLEYHGSFEAYARVKARYFRYLPAGTPLVYSAGDRAVVALVARQPLHAIGCGRGPDADVGVEQVGTDADGTDLVLHVRVPLPRLGAAPLAPQRVPLRLRLLGRPNANNAALAATAGLCLGAPVDAVRAALAALAPPPRRMQIVQRTAPTVLDDTVGHPDSITAVFEVAAALPHRRLHVVFAIRGQRGAPINRGDAEALAIWAARVPIATLVVTPSVEAADERNRVAPEERAAFVERLREGNVTFRELARLSDAVDAVLAAAGDEDLVLLLGAQGMDAGAALVRERLEGRVAPGGSRVA